MKVSLVVAQGPKQGTPIPISKPEFVIGREATCQLRPASQAISKRHCAVLLRSDKVFIKDLGSTNGTYVNKQAVKGERELKDGDELSIASTLFFKIKIETAAQVPTQVDQKTRRNAPVTQPAAPVTTPAPTLPPGEPMDEDAIGSMLLTLTEEGDLAAPKEEDMDGTTIMQMLKPEEVKKLDEAGPYRPPQKQAADQDTTSAAKAILDKYRRRPRS